MDTNEQLLQHAFEHLDMTKFVEHVAALSSDEFQGRFPNTIGETKSLEYMTTAFRDAGAVPVNASFLQPVPFVELSSRLEEALVSGHDGGVADLALQFPADIAVISKRVQPRIDLDRVEMVFVGYGIVAPEYDWNDYASVDVRGKVVLCLVNDPGLRTNDPSGRFFRGKTLTYYGRWTYKYEEASRQGAAGCLIVHDTAAAGYPWHVVVAGKDRPHLSLVPADKVNAGRVPIEGWLSADAAERLLNAFGYNFQDLVSKAHLPAETRSFQVRSKKTDCAAQFTLRMRNESRFYSSHNFVAMIPGTDRRDECVVFSAHWDHLGTKDGQIFHGAVDNAAGVASLIELARAIHSMPSALSRSVLFFCATAEEQGLLGAEHYCEHPLVALQRTVAILNIDILNVMGATRDVSFFGYLPQGPSAYSSSLHPLLEELVAAEQRYISPDPMPEWGFYFRSDHFPFAKRGVAGLFLGAGTDNPELGRAVHTQKLLEWNNTRYHKPADVYSAEWWRLDGVRADLRLLLRVAYRLTQVKVFPTIAL